MYGYEVPVEGGPGRVGNRGVRLLTWNIRNPSLDRAKLQAEWLATLSRPDVVVLTECKSSNGTHWLRDSLTDTGYEVAFGEPPGREYGVVLAALPPADLSVGRQLVDYLPSRVASASILRRGAPLEVIGVYAPSRGFDLGDRLERKRRFAGELLGALEARGGWARTVVIGDLNVLEPEHVPRYKHFQEWEYDFYSGLAQRGFVDAFRHVNKDGIEHSWFGRSGNGYRYDHCFVSADLVSRIGRCLYVHDPRTLKLSDHSAMELELTT